MSGRVKEKAETIYILERHELDSQKLRLIGDKCTSQAGPHFFYLDDMSTIYIQFSNLMNSNSN